MNYLSGGIIFISFFLFSLSTFSQVQAEYIEKHKDLAIYHMHTYKIPASIKLAQALLESGAGKSALVKAGNNHFGIKCHKGWDGECIPFDDDAPQESFCKYKSVEDSWDHHSRFLTRRGRYSFLFEELDIKDYKGWAKGLQKAGYATDKKYADKLISMIERYQLHKYDSAKPPKNAPKPSKKEVELITDGRNFYKTPAGLLYVEARAGDTYSIIAKEIGFKEKDLMKYNDRKNHKETLTDGEVVYLEMKMKKTNPPHYYHVVSSGETMHSISQRYGIRMDNLYKMNGKKSNYQPEKGEQLKLR
ncbi:MAG: glucosaminidase domain-containing protein [Candidatus Azobacteroides sp.]|nr:glucosaminidase domain-containing protein [Candidatus Azobacteroides sp.]